MEEIRKSQQSTKILKILLIFCVVFVVLCSTVLIVKYKFTITSVEVQGNEHYTDEEITNMVMSGKYGYNSIYPVSYTHLTLPTKA